MTTSAPRLLLAVMVAAVVTIGAVAPAAASQSTSSHSSVLPNNTTATNTPTSTPTPTATPTDTASQCDPSEPPKLNQARLFTREDTITTNQAGIIAGGFLPPAALQCDMKVRISMQVPNNMYIQGTKRLGSGGAGIVASTFTIPAGTGSVQSVRAKVFATETGQLTVTADVVYWPKGYPDLKRTISGLTLTFTVNEPNEPATTVTSTDGSDGQATDTPDNEDTPTEDDDNDNGTWPDPVIVAIIAVIVAIIGLTIVGAIGGITKIRQNIR